MIRPPSIRFQTVLRTIIAVLICIAVVSWSQGGKFIAGQTAVIAAVLLAIGFQQNRKWSSFAFSAWVLAFVLQAYCTPTIFKDWPSGPASGYLLRLIQVIMFAMGATLTVHDFSRVFAQPRSVGVGMLLQFSVMPMLGYLLAKLFKLHTEIALGVILIGACLGGVASNVITYIARGDVALSVTMTACSTLLSPLMTPLAVYLLAGSEINISFQSLAWSILEMTIVPVLAGLLASHLLQRLRWKTAKTDHIFSVFSMIAICIVIGIIVAQSREELLQVGLILFMVAIVHNALGYAFGYAGARLCGLNEKVCRTVAIEVGMQNGGMASALATEVLKSPQAAISGAIFGPWMSISGSILASWWRKRDESNKLQVAVNSTETHGANP